MFVIISMEPEEQGMQFGDDSDQENIIEEKKSFYDLNSYTVGNSVRTIIDMIEQDIIFLKPEFQREFIWDIRRASKLIDSLGEKVNSVYFIFSYFAVFKTATVIVYKLPKNVSLGGWIDSEIKSERQKMRDV